MTTGMVTATIPGFITTHTHNYMNKTARDNQEQAQGVLHQVDDSHRLPCRGCTSDCGNYPHCQGTPWRMQADTRNNQTHR
jgi:hypothetical protein